jgi:hypothetical protein
MTIKYIPAEKISPRKDLKPIDLYSFDCMGYCIVRNAVPAELLTEITSLINQTFPLKKVWKFPVLHLGHAFWDLMTLPVLTTLAQELCGEEFRLDHAFGVSSDEGVVNLHGGPNCSQRTCFAQWVGNTKILVGQLSAGFVLTHQSPETGGVCFVPGSHKCFDQRDGRTVKREVFDNHFDHDCIVVPTLNPGDLIVFSESLIHGDTGWKRQDYCRLTVYYKFCPGFMAWRDPAQQEQYRHLARNELERKLLEPPWSGRFGDSNNQLDRNNIRREKTVG